MGKQISKKDFLVSLLTLLKLNGGYFLLFFCFTSHLFVDQLVLSPFITVINSKAIAMHFKFEAITCSSMHLGVIAGDSKMQTMNLFHFSSALWTNPY